MQLRTHTQDWADNILLFAPQMSQSEYNTNKASLAIIDSHKENIKYKVAYSSNLSRMKFFITAPFLIWPKIWKTVEGASVVHSGPSRDPLNAFEIVALVIAVIKNKLSIFL